MPYIPLEDSKRYDDITRVMVLRLPEDVTQVDGHLNCIVTKILKVVYEPRYFNYNRAIGLLECMKQEYCRTTVTSYEEKKQETSKEISQA